MSAFDCFNRKQIVLLITLINTTYAAAAPSSFDDLFHFDQSQNVYFESFNQNVFSYSVLTARNKFNMHDIIVGGSTQFDGQYWNGNVINDHYQTGSGIYFTQATFDVMSNLNRWSTAFVSASEMYIANNNPDGNTFYWPNAFMLFGNLDLFPVYITAGISGIPFGIFDGTGPWDTPLTTSYFDPVQAPQISIAFYKNGWDLSATEYNDETNYQNHTACDVTYTKTIRKITLTAGAGYLTNLQANETSNNTVHKNTRPKSIANENELGNAIDLNGSVSLGPMNVQGEYNLSDKKIANNAGDPAAESLVFTFTQPVFGADTQFGVGYSATQNLQDVPTFLAGNDGISLAGVGLKNAWSLNISRTIFADNCFLALDWQRATTYPERNNPDGAITNTYTLDFTSYL